MKTEQLFTPVIHFIQTNCFCFVVLNFFVSVILCSYCGHFYLWPLKARLLGVCNLMHIFYIALSNRFMAQARREKGGSVVYSSERKKEIMKTFVISQGF